MRVFVVGTGRCGTCTFYQACSHITNYTVAHEGTAGHLDDLGYPNSHIEVSRHLTIQIPILKRAYPDSFWVHLYRDRDACIKSLASQSEVTLRNYARHWYQISDANLLEVAANYYDCINELIADLLGNQKGMKFQLETPKDSWWEFWTKIRATGDYKASLNEFNRRYNPSENRGRNNYLEGAKV